MPLNPLLNCVNCSCNTSSFAAEPSFDLAESMGVISRVFDGWMPLICPLRPAIHLCDLCNRGCPFTGQSTISWVDMHHWCPVTGGFHSQMASNADSDTRAPIHGDITIHEYIVINASVGLPTYITLTAADALASYKYQGISNHYADWVVTTMPPEPYYATCTLFYNHETWAMLKRCRNVGDPPGYLLLAVAFSHCENVGYMMTDVRTHRVSTFHFSRHVLNEPLYLHYINFINACVLVKC